MLEVFLDPFRLTLYAMQVPCGGLDQLHFGAHQRQLRYCLFEVGVDHFVEIELRIKIPFLIYLNYDNSFNFDGESYIASCQWR
jgi:hypothetical protein